MLKPGEKITVPAYLAIVQCPFGSFMFIGLISLYESKHYKDAQIWSLAPEFMIQEPIEKLL